MEEIRNDQEIAVIQKESATIQSKVQNLIVSDESSQKLASTWLAFLAKSIRRLEERRVFFTKPILESKKNIDREFQAMIHPLEQMSRELKDKLLGYSVVLKQRDEERKNQVKATAESLGLPSPEETAVESTNQSVRTTLGTSFSTKRWTWKIADETKIPREYLIIDEKKINAMMRAHQKTVKGVSSMDLKIDGIEFFQQEDIAVRT